MRYLLVNLSFVLLFGCLLDNESKSTLPDGKYAVTALREDGSIETKGWIELSVAGDGSISGTWQLEGLDGDGRLVGRQEGETISLDLHPDWADHNFLMNGTRRDGTISGRWEFVGIAGPMKGGTFVATR